MLSSYWPVRTNGLNRVDDLRKQTDQLYFANRETDYRFASFPLDMYVDRILIVCSIFQTDHLVPLENMRK